MQIRKILTAVFAAALLAAGAAAAKPADASPSQLYTFDGTAVDKTPQSLASRARVPDGAEEHRISVDPAVVAADPPSFLIDLPGHPLLEAVRTRFVDYGPDWKSWSGTLRPAGSEAKGTGYIHLGYHGAEMTALIDLDGERFRIVGLADGHRLVRLANDLGTFSCGERDSGESVESAFSDSGETAAGRPPRLITAAGAKTRIDVLALYPTEFFHRAASVEDGLFTFIQDSLAIANDIFVGNEVDARYNLVGIVPLTGQQPPSTGQFHDLAWMTGGGQTPVQAEVAALRNAFGADIVVLYTPFDWREADHDFCGASNEPLRGTQFYRGDVILQELMGDRAFSVHRVDCGEQDFTLAHEIGHNYGMRHDDQTENHHQANLYSYAQGFKYFDPVSQQDRATVMACVCTGCFCDGSCPLNEDPVCNRIPRFSDPTMGYDVVNPIGDALHDNARVARENVAAYSTLRPQSTNPDPTASFSVSCNNHTCTFNGSASSDNAGISSYYWVFGDSGNNSTGSGQIVSHTYSSSYPSGTSFRVHLVVTDTGGKTNTATGTATVTNPPPPPPPPIYEGYHEVANCRSISGWAWNQNSPNSAINVDILKDLTPVTTVAANLFRQDLVNAGKGNGYHAFVYTPSATWKDGLWRSALVRFGGTSTNLTWSPINIICGTTCFTTLTPQSNLDTGGQVYTVATQFSSSVSGYVTTLRFYRAAGESGTNVGKLWTDGGTQLATVNFPGSPSSGWVEVQLPTAVAITAGTLYRVSVTTNVRQSKTNCGIGSGITNQVLTAHQGFWIAGNVFPTTGSCSNFFVDVKFDL
jgi:Domain of unknown function (DUF4082)/PKD domain/Metallo-peptidase family M12